MAHPDTDSLSPVAQDYLKVIWSRTEWGGEPATTSALAARFGTSSANVTETVRRLASQGLLEHTPYKPVRLTDAGRAAAVAMVRRHRLIETFLVQTLGYGWDEVHDEAERLEHAVSDTLVARLDAMLDHPATDPHGDPIPSADGTTALPEGAVLLAEARLPGSFRIVRVSDADPDVLAAARERGLVPSATVSLSLAGVPDELARAVWAVPVLNERQADWEERYGGDAPIWSGRVNATTAQVVEELLRDADEDVRAGTAAPDAADGGGPAPDGVVAPAPAADGSRPRALDIGCGEGADALWLADHGYDVVGLDISANAVARAKEVAASAGLTDRMRFVVADLSDHPETVDDLGPFDLITASFFHSRLPMPRIEILRDAAYALADGGSLVVVSHASKPPWAAKHEEQHDADQPYGPSDLMTPEQEAAALALPVDGFEVVRAETVMREATGPDGEHAELEDGILVIRRRSAAEAR